MRQRHSGEREELVRDVIGKFHPDALPVTGAP
jgi:hypothetical protein